MSWEDRYFGPPPSTSRAVFAAAGTMMIFFGALLAIGSATQPSPSLGTRVLLLSSIALALYGVDLIVRSVRPRQPGSSFTGVTGALRLAGAIVFASLLVGLGGFGIVRGDLVSGSFVAAAGIAGMFLLLLARIRER
jgi:hypothetical protein